MDELIKKSEEIELKLKAMAIIADREYLIFMPNKDGIMGNIYGMGETLEEAEKEFWKTAKFMEQFYLQESADLQKKAIFLKGPWGKTGGNWFSIIGINIYFRYGKKMEGGFYIPFTNLNIRIHNHWLNNSNRR